MIKCAKSILLLILFSFSFFQLSKAQNYWAKLLEAPKSEIIESIVIEKKGGGFVLGGWTTSFDITYEDALIIRCDKDGNIIWQKYFGGDKLDFINKIIPTSDNCYLSIAGTQSFGAGSTDIWLIKFDTLGNILWNIIIGGEDDEVARDVIETKDGDFIVVGGSHSFGTGVFDGILLMLDNNGNLNKTLLYYTSENYNSFRSLVETDDGGYIVGGTLYSDSTNDDVWLVRINSDGNIEWQKAYGGPENEKFIKIIKSANGYLIAGTSTSFNKISPDVFLFEIDANGNVLWARNHFDNQITSINSILKTDNQFICAGATNKMNTFDYDFLLQFLELNGEFRTGKTYGGLETENLTAIALFPNGDLLLGGYSFSFGTGNSDILLLKTTSQGELPSGSVLIGSYNPRPENSLVEISSRTSFIEVKEIQEIQATNLNFTPKDAQLKTINLNYSTVPPGNNHKINFSNLFQTIIEEFNSNPTETKEIKILNLFGQEVLNFPELSPNEIIAFHRNIENLPKGLYILKFNNNKFIPFINI
ncbi:MAG: T9SS type A sorting domain-containing protein [Ignavibacteria bacterium]|nr:T9SS type A sorting domain-containing protein [Ignavibacteria bacterium]